MASDETSCVVVCILMGETEKQLIFWFVLEVLEAEIKPLDLVSAD